MFRESLKMSWQNIVHNKMRSFLTILGIVIGVAAIIALITTVQSVITEVNSQFDDLGANTLMVQAQGTALKMGLTDKDFEDLQAVEGIAGASPTVSAHLDIAQNGVVKENVSIQGKNELYFARNPDAVKAGRGLNILDVENKNRVCLISETLENDLFDSESAVGHTLRLGGIAYTIVGVTASSTDMTSMLMGTGDGIIVPYKNAMSLAGVSHIMAVEMYMEDGADTDAVIDDVEAVLSQAFNYKDNSFAVTNMESLLDMMHDMQNMMQTMLAGIASIALLVGGIGIMNMMLVSVTERTTEIGLRKALGAQPKRIQMQFLTEAIFLSLFGGIIGIAVGLLISLLVALAIDVGFAVSLSAIALGVGFSVLVGVVFGLAPARKASRLNPIDALRSV
ncbi:ABC transporter permease [Anaeromassilibacillus sp. SJQ-5]